MFKYVNDLSNEIEDLDKQISDLRCEDQQFTGSGTQVDINNTKKMKELEDRLARSGQQSEKYEFDYHETIKLINSLTNWVENLFNTIDCDKGVAKELAGST
jgi:regulator of replication initiation timing